VDCNQLRKVASQIVTDIRRHWRARGVDVEHRDREARERVDVISGILAELFETSGSSEAPAELTNVTKTGAN
jgi:hypothetical protein